MVKKKLPFQAFEKYRIATPQKQEIKGGYKYVPQGAQGSDFVIIISDIRGANLVQHTPPSFDASGYLTRP